MKSLIAAALFALCVPAFAQAKTYAIPDDEPMAMISLPDSWVSDDLDDGIEALSPDEAAYVAIEAVDRLDVDGALSAARVFFDDKGIVVDPDSMTKTDIEVGGYSGFSLSFQGHDEDGPTRVTVYGLQVSEAGALMVTFWAPDDGDALEALLASIQTPTKAQ